MSSALNTPSIQTILRKICLASSPSPPSSSSFLLLKSHSLSSASSHCLRHSLSSAAAASLCRCSAASSRVFATAATTTAMGDAVADATMDAVQRRLMFEDESVKRIILFSVLFGGIDLWYKCFLMSAFSWGDKSMLVRWNGFWLFFLCLSEVAGIFLAA